MDIFKIRGTDKRASFEEAFENGQAFHTQKWGGKDVEYFSPETGFVLLEKESKLRINSSRAGSAYVISKMSHGHRMNLRELYYTLRQTPKYHKYFNPNAFYAGVIQGVLDMEILCDVDRNVFVQGMPKGIFFYPHSGRYGDPKRLVAQSEDLVTETVRDYEVRWAKNVLAIEKMAIAEGLTRSDFPKLINSIISTTGGQFDRATRKLMNRFQHDKTTMALCDGDVWGVYMVQTCHIGSKNSRHLDDKMPNVIDAGLYPSVAKWADCPEDIDEKKPMNNPHAEKRVELLDFIGYPDLDLDVFREDNLTYELEALNTRFGRGGIPPPEGDPIGVQIYVTELLRKLDLPCKPQPTSDDEKLMEAFRGRAFEDFKDTIKRRVRRGNPIATLQEEISERINEVIDDIIDEIYEKYVDDLTEILDKVTVDQIRDKIAEQYQKKPTREIFSISEIAEELLKKVKVTVEWNAEDLKEKIADSVQEYVDELGSNIYSEEIELQDLPDAEELKPFYDVILEHIQAHPADARLVRDAIERRLGG